MSTYLKSADVLRRAAAKLRETANSATRGPWVAYPTISTRDDDQAWTLTRPYCAIDHGSPDECEPDCGVTVLTTGAEGCENDNVFEDDARWMELANPLLAEPLASWLEEMARQYEMAPCDKPDGVCNGCERRDDFVHAFNVAQVILGETSGVAG